jgi:toxin ParE1/3/4
VQVRWLRAALANLDAEAEYIARDNPGAAARVVQAITQAVDGLKQYPAMGRPGRITGTRELVVSGTPYIVPYRVRENEVEIVRIFHAARRWPTKF